VPTFRDLILQILSAKKPGITVHQLAQVLDGKVPRSTVYAYLRKKLRQGEKEPETTTKVLEQIISALGGTVIIHPWGRLHLERDWRWTVSSAKLRAKERRRKKEN